MHRKLFYGLNFLLLAAFAISAAVDHKREWRRYQKEFFLRSAASLEAKAQGAKDPEEAGRLKARARQMRRAPIQVRQIIAKDLGRVDRCVTCHVGMDEFVNPALTTEFKEHPFAGHPDVSRLFKNHPFQKYGCTACHGGQGLAADVSAAHGRVKFWEKPLLEGPLIQASCAKCHGNFEALRGAEAVATGKKLFEAHGCLGCHSLRGSGGVISVDLGNVADKPLERIDPYNFSLIKDENGKAYDPEFWKLPLWIEAHLTNVPMDFIPNDPHGRYNAEPIAPSGMPDFVRELPPGGAKAITAYLLSMTEEEVIPSRYYVPASPRREPKFASAVEHGRYVYRKYGCGGCHGLEGKQGRRNYNAMGPGQEDPEKDMDKGREPTLTDTVGTFTREELIKKIQNGVKSSEIAKFNPNGPVPPLYMPEWKDKIQGAELEDLVTYLMSTAKKEEGGW